MKICAVRLISEMLMNSVIRRANQGTSFSLSNESLSIVELMMMEKTAFVFFLKNQILVIDLRVCLNTIS